jgi:hypothetical protein
VEEHVNQTIFRVDGLFGEFCFKAGGGLPVKSCSVSGTKSERILAIFIP